jgi:colanic acid/amylovoran biosynthesis glycosyltransferase
MSNDRILLVLPLPIYDVNGVTFIDSQACTSLGLWLDNFHDVTMMGPQVRLAKPRTDISPTSTIRNVARLEIVPLPATWTPHRFIAALPAASKKLRQQIQRSNYLHFAIGGLWGDWAAIASVIARRQGRPYAVWTDRVESEVARYANQARTGLKRTYWSGNIALMQTVERHVIQHSQLGLFNGLDTFDAYAKFSSDPHLVFNISVANESFITDDELAQRLARAGPLRIIYAGRVHREKGVYDWLDALFRLSIKFEATWIGDGPELDNARALVEQHGQSLKIRFPGPISHAEVQSALSNSDVFLFCHKTPESPRCLIEALYHGLPLIGYDTAYPRSLIADSAGILTPRDQVSPLIESLSNVAFDKSLLASISQKAAIQGRKFSATAMFRHRSDLMRQIRTSN